MKGESNQSYRYAKAERKNGGEWDRKREGPPVYGLELNRVGFCSDFKSEIFRLHTVEKEYLFLVAALLLHGQCGYLFVFFCVKLSALVPREEKGHPTILYMQ